MSERDAAREILRELLHEALAVPNGRPATDPAGAAPSDAAPRVPAPPVAAVLRPSTWSGPPVRGEVVGDGGQGQEPEERGVELVTLESDEDLERFVRSLLVRFENPRERTAIHEGRLRFTLRRPGAGAPAAGIVRVDRGAVTERKVEAAAKAGARLVLGPGAVLTPLAREKARARGVELERER